MTAKKNPRDIVRDFVDSINSGKVDSIAALMSSDHQFIDGLGQVFKGKEVMKKGWKQYFGMFLDYRIEIENILDDGKDTVGIFGYASGTFAGSSSSVNQNHETKKRTNWKIPAAWKATVKNGLVSKWQVYTDNEPVWKVMGVKRY